MKSSENSREGVPGWIPDVREFGMRKFGTLRAFAEALGMTPQNLNGYLTGERKPGRIFIARLSGQGFDITKLLLDENTQAAVRDSSATGPAKPCESIDFEAAERVLGRPLERAAPQFGATTEEVQSWRNGVEPPLDKLVRLTNLILFVATDGRLQLRELEPSSVLPAAGEQARVA